MAFFFDNGVQKQLESTTETEANRNFAISCSICCSRGYNMKCAQCPIASANEQQKAAILDARKADRQRKARVTEEARKLNDIIQTAMKMYKDVRVPSDIEAKSVDLEKLADEFLKMKGGKL